MIWLACVVWTDYEQNMSNLRFENSAGFMHVEAETDIEANALALEVGKLDMPGHQYYSTHAIPAESPNHYVPHTWANLAERKGGKQ